MSERSPVRRSVPSTPASRSRHESARSGLHREPQAAAHPPEWRHSASCGVLASCRASLLRERLLPVLQCELRGLLLRLFLARTLSRSQHRDLAARSFDARLYLEASLVSRPGLLGVCIAQASYATCLYALLQKRLGIAQRTAPAVALQRRLQDRELWLHELLLDQPPHLPKAIFPRCIGIEIDRRHHGLGSVGHQRRLTPRSVLLCATSHQKMLIQPQLDP